MPLRRFLALLAAGVLVGAPTLLSSATNEVSTKTSAWPASVSDFSVMTYNVKGLPWPLAGDREPALVAIGHRLREMRTRGIQPRVVLLQEAFVKEAKSIGQVAGYSYMATGPTPAEIRSLPSLGSTFANGASWLKGEKSGSVIDSGLVVLSDYPIVRTRRFAFPEGACAGYDCLAAKGVVVAWIEVPGAGQPIAVANTHFNSRRSTHVPGQRADAAYAWQVAAAREFLSRTISPETPVVFGGDFNVGQIPRREKVVARQPMIGPGQTDGLPLAIARNETIPASLAEAEHIVARNKDKILSRSGSRTELEPVRAWVPFRLSTTANPLSDHAGFVIDYRLAVPSSGLPPAKGNRIARPATRPAQLLAQQDG